MSKRIKLIHTSDWHLGHRLYNYDRTEEENDFFEKLSDLVEKERPDALLVSGDIYHTCAPGNEVSRLFTDRLLEVQSRCPEMEIIVTAGNHDSYSRLEIDQSLWGRCHVRILGTPAEKEDGTADFDRNIIKLDGKVVIAAVPFCHPRNFPFAEMEAGDTARDAAYFQGLRQAVCRANEEQLPTVLMAHLAVGKEISFTGQEKTTVIGGEECVEPEVLGSGYDYIALGHIHCPQWVKKQGKKLARYCGTPRPIHFDEQHGHGVDIVEIEEGKEVELRSVPLVPLRALRTLGGEKGLPFGDALQSLGQTVALEHWKEGDYLRINVSLKKEEKAVPDWGEQARKAAESCGLRYCLINYIREKDEESVADESQKPSVTIEELQNLNDEQVLNLLKKSCKITDAQVELLRELMAEIKQ